MRGYILILILLIPFFCSCSGNSATVKPNNELDNKLKTSLDNQQAMKENIDVLSGHLTKIQQSITNVMNTVINTINQKFETLQGSTKTGDVEGSVHSSQDTNSTWYGLGLVGIVLLFTLCMIWLVAKLFGK